tara:strand:+ start:5126 stop:7207 length:2082 start_codon:yes stop_codon:yes gene_type:complete
MAKGYGADASLVAAAYRLGQSYGPADYTGIFKMQYEGLIDAFKAKTEAQTAIVGSIAEGVTDVLKVAGERKGERGKEQEELFDKMESDFDFDSQLDEAVTAHADGSIRSQKENHENLRKPPNKDIFSVEQAEYETYKKQIEDIGNKLFITKKDKNKRLDLIRQTLDLREKMNQRRGSDKAIVDKFDQGFYDLKLSHEKNPDLMVLTQESLNKDGDLKSLGVTTYMKNNELYYKYPVGLSGNLYRRETEFDPNKDNPILAGPTKQEFREISHKQLTGGLVEVDNKSRNDIEATLGTVISAAQEMTTSEDQKLKITSIENYDKIEPKTLTAIEATLNSSKSYRNLTNNDIRLGENTINWSKDLPENIQIDIAIASQLGIGSDVLSAEDIMNIDEDDSGTLDQAELDKHMEAKNLLIDKLLNPKTYQEKQASVQEFSKYLSGYMRQGFDERRERMGLATKKSEDKATKEFNRKAYLAGLKKQGTSKTVRLPWETDAKGDMIPIAAPTTDRGRDQYNLALGVAKNQKSIAIGKEKFELQNDGSYQQVEQLTKEGWVDVEGGIKYGRTKFLQQYGGRYGQVPGNYAPEGWGKPIAKVPKNPFGIDSADEAPVEVIEAMEGSFGDDAQANVDVIKPLLEGSGYSIKVGGRDRITITGHGVTKTFVVDPTSGDNKKRSNQIWKWLQKNWVASKTNTEFED